MQLYRRISWEETQCGHRQTPAPPPSPSQYKPNDPPEPSRMARQEIEDVGKNMPDAPLESALSQDAVRIFYALIYPQVVLLFEDSHPPHVFQSHRLRSPCLEFFSSQNRIRNPCEIMNHEKYLHTFRVWSNMGTLEQCLFLHDHRSLILNQNPFLFTSLGSDESNVSLCLSLRFPFVQNHRRGHYGTDGAIKNYNWRV